MYILPLLVPTESSSSTGSFILAPRTEAESPSATDTSNTSILVV